MRKLYFLMKDAFNQGGDTRSILLLANTIQKTGLYEINIISLFKTSEEPIFPINEEIKISCLFTQPFSLRKNFIKVLTKFNDFVKNNQIDVLLIEAIGFNTFTYPVLRKYKKIKTIAVEHASYFDGGKKLGLAWIGRKIACKHTDCVVVLTKQDLNDYTKNIKKIKRIEQIYNPLDNNIGDYNYNINSKKIISCGRLVSVKGFDMLIDVAKLVFEKHPEWQWHIYGEGPEREFLEKKVRQYKLEKNLFLMGEVSDIYSIYNNYSLYVLTSRAESFGMVLLEALKFRLPIVSFACKNGPEEIINDGVNGILIPCFDKDLMATTISKLIEDHNYRKSLSDRTQINLNTFNISEITNTWLRLIESI